MEKNDSLQELHKRGILFYGGINMCQHGDLVEIEIVQRIKVDRCIAEEIKWLNAQDVRTEGCCCGHGREAASAIIQPSSVKRATELGYEPEICGPTHRWEIKLKHAEGAGK